MRTPTKYFLSALGVVLTGIVVLVIGFVVWADRAEESCWKNESALVFKKYNGLTFRDKILHTADVDKDPGTSFIEIIERDQNGCSLGSNGQTVVRFYFGKDNKLAEIQVYKNYLVANYKMVMIGKKVF